MDIKSLLGTVMSGDSVSGVGKAANVSASSARNILGAALPGLLSGAAAQAENSDTAAGFAGALSQHAASDTSNLGDFLSGVDMADGSKIVSHLLGDSAGETIGRIAQKTGATQEETSGVLSAAAPLLMSLLGQQAEKQEGSGTADLISSLTKGADIGSLLSGLTGDGESSGEEKSAGGVLKNLLGKLF